MRFFHRVSHAQTATEIQILQIDSRAAQFLHIARNPPKRATKRSKRNNLRADVRADSLPLQIFGILMRKIEPPRFRPIETKFVSVASGCNVRMAACRDIRVHTNRNRWNLSTEA